ncbi:MAG TPA: hypothetical protein ENJ93_06095 [Chloroflexi bacterium]|nr:hypothetical protein [Chloroflexota bacterium]
MKSLRSLNRSNALLLLLAVVVFIFGYGFFRFVFVQSDNDPLSQEIVLIFLGSFVTVLITAVLLNKQTEVELKKEENLNFLDLKKQIYMDLIDHLEDVVLSGETSDDDIIKLQFLNQKLALVADPDVLVEFEKFIRVFAQIAQDPDLDKRETNQLMSALSSLTITIRADLIGPLDQNEPFTSAQIAKQITVNNQSFELMAPLDES